MLPSEGPPTPAVEAVLSLTELVSGLVCAMLEDGPLLCESVVATIVQIFHGARRPTRERLRRVPRHPHGLLSRLEDGCAPAPDLLFAFEHDQTRHLLPGMAAACEGWFVGQRAQHDLVAPQLISYLILLSLRENAKASGTAPWRGGWRTRWSATDDAGPLVALGRADLGQTLSACTACARLCRC